MNVLPLEFNHTGIFNYPVCEIEVKSRLHVCMNEIPKNWKQNYKHCLLDSFLNKEQCWVLSYCVQHVSVANTSPTLCKLVLFLLFAGLCPDWETWDPVRPVENATEAMQLADDWLGIPQVGFPPLFAVTALTFKLTFKAFSVTLKIQVTSFSARIFVSTSDNHCYTLFL